MLLAWRLSQLGHGGARLAVRAMFAQMSVVERAALFAAWDFWARPKQLAPAGSWRSWGFLTGRGFGKTLAISQHINAEVRAGRARLIGLAAQDEENAIAIQVEGPSGLIATALPDEKPHFEATSKQLVWPNGARAYVRTPEVPGKIRGLEYHLSWISELQSWPMTLRQEAYDNFLLSTRLGYARIVWDSTPKKKHPILLQLLEQHEKDPRRHAVVRGTTHENAMNLGEGYVEELEKRFKGTARGREELLGEMLAEAEAALVRQKSIDDARRPALSSYARRAIGVDPAVTVRKGNDRTGIVKAGLGSDGQGYVLGDYSGKHEPAAWAKIVLDQYEADRCDVVVAETNKGGQLVTQNLRSAASERGAQVIVLAADERRQHQTGFVYVREVHARGPKEDRAQPMATAYARGRISHVIGVDLTALEETLTTWEPTPGARSPDDLDALTHVITELLGLASNLPDAKLGFPGIVKMQQAASRREATQVGLAALLQNVNRGRF